MFEQVIRSREVFELPGGNPLSKDYTRPTLGSINYAAAVNEMSNLLISIMFNLCAKSAY